MHWKKNLLYICLPFMVILSLSSQTIKAGIIPDPTLKHSEFFKILSEQSGIKIQQIPLLPRELNKALDEGIIDMAIMAKNKQRAEIDTILIPFMGRNYALISDNNFIINEHNLINLRTIGVIPEDEPLFTNMVIERFSINPRIQKTRQYDSLVRLLSTGRVPAIFIPVEDFHRIIRITNLDPLLFSRPFMLGFSEDMLYISIKRDISDLFDRIKSTIVEMHNDQSLTF